jgi:phosphate uptake regulator
LLHKVYSNKKIYIVTMCSVTMTIDIRKLQLVGNRSYAVSLPKEWILDNKLKEQDKIFIERTKQNTLTISTSKIEIKKSIDINIDEIDNISEFIMFCYIKNVDKLILKSKELTYEKSVKIRQIISFLEGYDIVSEDKNKIEIAFLFKDIQITVPDIHKRMLYMLNTMLEAIKNRDLETVELMEKNIDRMYHLSKRTIISCINDSKKQQENSVEGWEDLFFLKDISKKLEKIGDIMYSIRKEKLIGTREKNIRILLDAVALMLPQKKELETVEAMLDKISEFENIHKDIILHKIHERGRDIFENALSMEYNKKYFK